MDNKGNIQCKDKMEYLGIIVVVPTYNNDKTLHNVIESIKLYSRNILVVNDGSTDNTAEILKNSTDIQVISLPKNKGKGYALKTALLTAKEQGFRYAITIDSDGQHYPSDIPAFIEAIEAEPDSLLVGARNFETCNMPGKNSFANKFSNFWFRLETGIKLEDTQSGYRLYPLHKIGRMKYYTTRYEFELELIVFSAWKGVNVKNIPINIYYPPHEERVSHFHPLRDFTRISILNTFLITICFFWIWPKMFFRNLTWENIKKFINKNIIHSPESNAKITLAIMLGIFMGIVPIWGYQMLAAVFLAALFKLNKVIVLVASNISIPPVMPFLLYGSYATGCYATGNRINLNLMEISLESMKNVLFQYLIGSIIFALFLSCIIGLISGSMLLAFRKNPAKDFKN